MFQEQRKQAEKLADDMGYADGWGRFEFFTEQELDVLIKTQALINKAQAHHTMMHAWVYFSYKGEVQELKMIDAYNLIDFNLSVLEKAAALRIRLR